MNRVQVYLASPLVTLSRFDHPADVAHSDPEEECSGGYSINFVERGGFTLRVGRGEWGMAAGAVFVARPGLVFRCRHAEEVPQDVCLSVDYAEGFADEIGAPETSRRRTPPAVAPLTNRLAYLHARLARLAASPGEVLAAETLAGELFAEVSRGDAGGARGLHKPGRLAWYVERVEAARALLESDYAARHTLTTLARFTGMSPFHFARVFREFAGTPPHRYLIRVRLARASERLRDGAGVTDACYASGFANLSHFIRLFRRAYGVTPSQFAPGGKGAAARLSSGVTNLRRG